MAEVMRGYFEHGVEAGMSRAREYDIDVPRDAIEKSLDGTWQVIEEWPEGLSGRFQQEFVADITVASLARVRYEDQLLEEPDLRASLGFWRRIFNSFAHDE
jgi:hypothetical protein